MNIWQLIRAGGFTMVVLLAASVLSIAIILERIIVYRRNSRVKMADFMVKIRQEMKKERVSAAAELSRDTAAPFSQVIYAGLSFFDRGEKEMFNNMERRIVMETALLERRTPVLGTIGNISVYIGLFGTVLGIIRAFHDISVSGSGGISVVISGISQALVTTAAGLCVAVPAVVAYNYFIKKIDDFTREMELAASEIMDLAGAIKK
ncbi:MAG: MotA/TolQ/ExbB proton channel family protein [Candidatus Omnitrophica bacterium]|jgi:biopolymer transport protein ExbB/TolQ|nr:MotA/TolQ/ExbB proton channel family protein [Candidatus Omnitrophota bacterium]MDD3274178.1 MotA/TolQ/ExbB proton channel family protein [Candidatus Omnitrophota bacterium]MDD5078232.1 MotA/TolQ/ExbB proton channel family protein [Candidatus Omnitrophota bacterium]